jgi:hypothetical protein
MRGTRADAAALALLGNTPRSHGAAVEMALLPCPALQGSLLLLPSLAEGTSLTPILVSLVNKVRRQGLMARDVRSPACPCGCLTTVCPAPSSPRQDAAMLEVTTQGAAGAKKDPVTPSSAHSWRYEALRPRP